jgi:spermidine synthase
MENPIDIREEGGVRFLHFGTDWVQGAMRIRTPFALELPYTREMMSALLMHESPWPRRVLSIGLGAGSLAKFIYRKLPDTHHTIVEIEPRVVAIAQSCFDLPRQNERMQIIIEDGLKFVDDTEEKWDLILLDAYDHDVRPGPLNSFAFYHALRQRLSEHGVLSINLFNRARRYAALIDQLDTAFDSRSLAFASTDQGNFIALGFAGETVESDDVSLRARAEHLRDTLGIDLRPVVARLLEAGAARGGRLSL